MRLQQLGGLGLSAGLALALAGPALADVNDVNGLFIQERFFNDHPETVLITTNNYPTLVSFVEGNYQIGGFANRHRGMLSSDGGTTARSFLHSEPWDISFDVTLDGSGEGSMNGEAGFLLETGFGDAQFIVKSNDEVAVFGGEFPFFSFGGAGSGAYTLGSTARMGMIYDPSGPTIEYVYDDDAAGPNPPVSSGPLAFAGSGTGIADGALVGVYTQGNPQANNTFNSATFEDFVVVPEPAGLLLLGLGSIVGLRRTRRG
jgi:hypothetical protein